MKLKIGQQFHIWAKFRLPQENEDTDYL